MQKFPAFLIAVALAGSFATAAAAHPELLQASPAADAVVGGKAKIKLVFSEKLTPKLSGATLTMTGMPGMAHHPDMKMTGWSSKVGPDGKSIELVSAKPLPAGTYRVDWFVVGGDKHRITGKYSFSVR